MCGAPVLDTSDIASWRLSACRTNRRLYAQTQSTARRGAVMDVEEAGSSDDEASRMGVEVRARWGPGG